MCFGWRPRKTEPVIRPDEEEEMPDVFVTRPTIMTEMGPRETKIVTKVKSYESTEVWGRCLDGRHLYTAPWGTRAK